MRCSRRNLLKCALAGAPVVFLGPRSFVRAAFGAGSGSSTKTLILFEMFGGNDGFNTLVPFGLDSGTYYTEFRDKLAVPESTLLKLDSEFGFNPAFREINGLYDAGKVAICNGVSYPRPNFSHEVSANIWATGDPTSREGTGWFGRHMARRPQPDFPCAAEMAGTLGTVFSGSGGFVPSVGSLDDFQFPFDFEWPEDADNRRAAYETVVRGLDALPGTVGEMARTSGGLLDLIDTFATVPEFEHVGNYPDEYVAMGLREMVRLMDAGLGLSYFHVGVGGFDTHADQDKANEHANLLATVSRGIDAVLADLTAAGLADDALIIVYSEFGRTVYENGSKGTDHGTVNQAYAIGNAVSGGIWTPHPSMHVDDLTEEEEELPMTTDFRDVLGTVVDRWLDDDPAAIFPGHTHSDLGFLP